MVITIIIDFYFIRLHIPIRSQSSLAPISLAQHSKSAGYHHTSWTDRWTEHVSRCTPSSSKLSVLQQLRARETEGGINWRISRRGADLPRMYATTCCRSRLLFRAVQWWMFMFRCLEKIPGTNFAFLAILQFSSAQWWLSQRQSVAVAVIHSNL